MSEEGPGSHNGFSPIKKQVTSTVAAATDRNGSSGDSEKKSLEFEDPPMSPRDYTRNPFSRQHTTLDMDDYFVRPPPSTSFSFHSVQMDEMEDGANEWLLTCAERTKRHNSPLEMAHLHAHARFHPPKDDPPPPLGRGLVDNDNVHQLLRPPARHLLHPPNHHRFRRLARSVLPLLHGL